MTKISYIDIVRNVHIDWVTADLEQEATRKGSGTSKRGARVVSSKSRKTPILGVHCDSTLRDARADSESGRVIWNLGTPDIIYDIKVPLISYYDIIVLTYDIIVLTYDIMRMIS